MNLSTNIYLSKRAEIVAQAIIKPLIPFVYLCINYSEQQKGPNSKVATYRLVYRAEPKEPTQFGSVSGSEIQNLPFLPAAKPRRSMGHVWLPEDRVTVSS